MRGARECQEIRCRWRLRGGFVFPLDFVSCGERGLRHLAAAKAVAKRARSGAVVRLSHSRRRYFKGAAGARKTTSTTFSQLTGMGKSCK